MNDPHYPTLQATLQVHSFLMQYFRAQPDSWALGFWLFIKFCVVSKFVHSWNTAAILRNVSIKNPSTFWATFAPPIQETGVRESSFGLPRLPQHTNHQWFSTLYRSLLLQFLFGSHIIAHLLFPLLLPQFRYFNIFSPSTYFTNSTTRTAQLSFLPRRDSSVPRAVLVCYPLTGLGKI